MALLTALVRRGRLCALGLLALAAGCDSDERFEAFQSERNDLLCDNADVCGNDFCDVRTESFDNRCQTFDEDKANECLDILRDRLEQSQAGTACVNGAGNGLAPEVCEEVAPWNDDKRGCGSGPD